MTDTWVARTAAEYAQAIESELPSGAAWPRDPDSGLMKWVSGCAQIWGDVDARAATLLTVESDPRYTVELLPDWEAAFGLPDPCVESPQTIPDRQAALVTKLTILGGQSRAFFTAAAASLGYTVSIYEYAPYCAGLGACGETRPDGTLTETFAVCGGMACGSDPICTIVQTGGDEPFWQLGEPELRYYWRMKITGSRVTYLRGGTGVLGQDHMAEISLAVDLECLTRRWAPAHGVVLFDYSAVDVAPAGLLTGVNAQGSLVSTLLLL